VLDAGQHVVVESAAVWPETVLSEQHGSVLVLPHCDLDGALAFRVHQIHQARFNNSNSARDVVLHPLFVGGSTDNSAVTAGGSNGGPYW